MILGHFYGGDDSIYVDLSQLHEWKKQTRRASVEISDLKISCMKTFCLVTIRAPTFFCFLEETVVGTVRDMKKITFQYSEKTLGALTGMGLPFMVGCPLPLVV